MKKIISLSLTLLLNGIVALATEATISGVDTKTVDLSSCEENNQLKVCNEINNTYIKEVVFFNQLDDLAVITSNSITQFTKGEMLRAISDSKRQEISQLIANFENQRCSKVLGASIGYYKISLAGDERYTAILPEDEALRKMVLNLKNKSLE